MCQVFFNCLLIYLNKLEIVVTAMHGAIAVGVIDGNHIPAIGHDPLDSGDNHVDSKRAEIRPVMGDSNFVTDLEHVVGLYRGEIIQHGCWIEPIAGLEVHNNHLLLPSILLT